MLLAASALLPAAGRAAPRPGFDSSTSIDISVSVAPRYQLLAVRIPNSASDRDGRQTGTFCMASNARAMSMPVMLVWPAVPLTIIAGPGANTAQTAIEWCESTNAKTASLSPRPSNRPTALLLIRPE